MAPDPDAGSRRWAASPRPGAISVGLVLLAAGLLFSTSAQTARGTQLRSERGDLPGLIQDEQTRVAARTQRLIELQAQVDAETRAESRVNGAIADLERRSSAVAAAAGVQAVHGPGLTVSLNDAPRDAPVLPGTGPDDLVVHQQDVQAVVNALWAGGAEAMMLQDQRVISTSAVRCVGNTLLLQGRVYSPPYVISAIGDVDRLRQSLDAFPEVSYYLQYVAALRLGWSVREHSSISMPAYRGSLVLRHATVLQPGTLQPGPTAAAAGTPAATGSAAGTVAP